MFFGPIRYQTCPAEATFDNIFAVFFPKHTSFLLETRVNPAIMLGISVVLRIHCNVL
jgi:hypothetical protein